jgi:hypothetical protein
MERLPPSIFCVHEIKYFNNPTRIIAKEMVIDSQLNIIYHTFWPVLSLWWLYVNWVCVCVFLVWYLIPFSVQLPIYYKPISIGRWTRDSAHIHQQFCMLHFFLEMTGVDLIVFCMFHDCARYLYRCQKIWSIYLKSLCYQDLTKKLRKHWLDA